MHSRIFEIRKEPFEEKDDMRMFDWEDLEYLPNGIDYVKEPESSRESDIQWLFDYLGQFEGVTFNEESFVLEESFKTNYFQPKLKSIKEKVESMSLDDFINEDGMSLENYTIEILFNDDYSFRVFTYENWHDSLDDFLRRAEVGQEYFIGGIGDFHY